MTYIEYDDPCPPTTDRPAPGQDCCEDAHDDWLCTRIAGHDGNHEAGGVYGQKIAEWSDEPS